jgi:hypothetical protein
MLGIICFPWVTWAMLYASEKKIYENRTRPIKPGVYALYASSSANKSKQFHAFVQEHNLALIPENFKNMENKIVGIMVVHKYWRKGEEDYPINKHANGEYTHLITCYPLPEEEYISGAYKRGQVVFMRIENTEWRKKLLCLL